MFRNTFQVHSFIHSHPLIIHPTLNGSRGSCPFCTASGSSLSFISTFFIFQFLLLPLLGCSSKPLQIWDKTVRNGHIKRITDNDIQSSVLEIIGTNVSTNYITCPAQSNMTLGIKLPFLVMIIKNLKKYFTFEVQVLDDKNVRRRFRASNYQVRDDLISPP